MGSLRVAAMPSDIEVELPTDSDVNTLIDSISNEYPKVANSLKSPSGNLIFLNGVEVGNLRGLETRLNDCYDVVLVPVAHGG